MHQVNLGELTPLEFDKYKAKVAEAMRQRQCGSDTIEAALAVLDLQREAAADDLSHRRATEKLAGAVAPPAAILGPDGKPMSRGN